MLVNYNQFEPRQMRFLNNPSYQVFEIFKQDLHSQVLAHYAAIHAS